MAAQANRLRTMGRMPSGATSDAEFPGKTPAMPAAYGSRKYFYGNRNSFCESNFQADTKVHARPLAHPLLYIYSGVRCVTRRRGPRLRVFLARLDECRTKPNRSGKSGTRPGQIKRDTYGALLRFASLFSEPTRPDRFRPRPNSSARSRARRMPLRLGWALRLARPSRGFLMPPAASICSRPRTLVTR